MSSSTMAAPVLRRRRASLWLLFVQMLCLTFLLCCTGCTLFSKENRAYSNGLSFAEKKDYLRAIEQYTRAVQINPKFAQAYLARAEAHSRRGNHVQVIADVTMALSLGAADDSGGWYHLRGCAYRSLGDNEKALADFSKAVELGDQFLHSWTLNSNPRFDAKREFQQELRQYHEDRQLAAATLRSQPASTPTQIVTPGTRR